MSWLNEEIPAITRISTAALISQIGRAKEIFYFNLAVYFLFVREFFFN